LGIPLVAGREFNAGDSTGAPKVAVINEALAKKYFGQRDPLGLRAGFGGGKVALDMLIVGIVKNDKQDHVRSELEPFIFVPYSQRDLLYGMSFYVRTQQDPLLLADEIRDGVRSIDPNLPVYDLKTFNRVVDEDLLAERLIAAMSAGFGLLAGLLAALGIYGVLAYLVVQRTREIGIRMALGASTREVRSLIFKEVGFMVIAGCAVGLPVAYAFARLSQSLLFGVKANSFDIYLLALGVIAIVAAAACYLPVRRAIGIDPVRALRYE
jgi:predicted permease